MKRKITRLARGAKCGGRAARGPEAARARLLIMLWSATLPKPHAAACNTIGEIGRGFQQQMEQFQQERMIAAYLQVGALQKALDRTRDYLAQRQVFGRPLLANDHIGYRLAELSAQLDLVRHYNYACAEAYLRGENTTRFATIAKLSVGR